MFTGKKIYIDKRNNNSHVIVFFQKKKRREIWQIVVV